MKKKILTIALLINLLTAESITINSLGEMDNVIKYSEGKALIREQLRGLNSKSPFGTALPSWITTKELSKLIAPNEQFSHHTLLGMKPWRKEEHTSVAIGCYSDEKIEKRERPFCSEGNVYLAIFKNKKLIARTSKPIDIEVNFDNTKLMLPLPDDKLTNPHQYVKFDFAPYKIKKDKFAFGVRVSWFSGFAGGGASLEALVLFVQKNDKLIQIFSEPMYAFSDIAGEWNEDSTRKHQIDEEKNILIVQKRMTNGYYDLKVKSLDSKFSKIFVFDKRRNRYVAKR